MWIFKQTPDGLEQAVLSASGTPRRCKPSRIVCTPPRPLLSARRTAVRRGRRRSARVQGSPQSAAVLVVVVREYCLEAWSVPVEEQLPTPPIVELLPLEVVAEQRGWVPIEDSPSDLEVLTADVYSQSFAAGSSAVVRRLSQWCRPETRFQIGVDERRFRFWNVANSRSCRRTD